MTTRVTATEAARNFSDLVNRVHYRGESFDIVRGGEVVARITNAPDRARCGATELVAALERAGHTDEAFADDLDGIQRDQPSLPADPWDS